MGFVDHGRGGSGEPVVGLLRSGNAGSAVRGTERDPAGGSGRPARLPGDGVEGSAGECPFEWPGRGCYQVRSPERGVCPPRDDAVRGCPADLD
jgi:hypothetical protein